MTGHPHRERWYEIGRRFKEHFHRHFYGEAPADYDGNYPVVRGTCRVQAVRSVSDWSHGVLTERSIQNACMCRTSLVDVQGLTA